MTATVRRLVAGTVLVVAAVMPGFLTAGLATRIGRDFAFSASDLGLAVAAFYFMSAVGSTPAGRFVDRAGAVVGVRWSGGLLAAACGGIALAADSAAALTALLLVAGAGNALAGPAGSELFRDELPSGRQGLGLGILQAGAPVGALLAGLALPAIAIPFGWRWAFAIAGVIAVASAVGAGRPSAPHAGRASRPSQPLSESAAARERAARREVRVLGVVSALASGAAMGTVSFLVLYAVDNGMSEGLAGALLAGVSLAAAVGRVVVGATSDRRPDPMPLVVSLLAVSTLGYALLLTAEPVGIAVGALVVTVAGWSWPGALIVAVTHRAAAAPAWAIGVMMAGLFVGAMGGPVVVGQIVEAGHTSLPWIVCAAVAVLAALAANATVHRSESLTNAARKS